MRKLATVDKKLQTLVKEAIKISSVDFGVLEGLRTLERQIYLKAHGKTTTLKSKHLKGHAVDLLRYKGKKASFKRKDYYPIVNAIKKVAKEKGYKIRWGGAWNIKNIATAKGTPYEMVQSYIILRERQGRSVFIDCPHFELM